MRVIVLFDLPVETSAQRQAYTRFRKHLVKSGFLMLQESVYCKLALNATAVTAISDNVRKEKPKEGLVYMLTVTEKQFARMEIITGEWKPETVHTDERMVII